MEKTNLGKASIGLLVGAWVFNAIGITAKATASLYVGLVCAVLAMLVGAIGVTVNRNCSLSNAGLGIAGAVVVAWLVMNYIGWDTFFD